MTSTDIALREAVDGRIAQFRDPGFEQQVSLAVPEGVSPRKLLRAAATAVLENPDLAREDLKASLIRATLKSAQDGLLPDGREAAFVIFEGKNPSVAYMPMVGGLRKIAAEFGWALFTSCVYEKDGFDPDFENGRANHKPPRLGTPRGPMLGAYAVAQHKDGRRMLEVMDGAEIAKVRNVSRSKDSGPWKDWPERMAEKTVARRLFKSLPLDSKDRERVDRVLAATAEDGVVELYGPTEDSPGFVTASGEQDQPAGASQESSAPAAGSDEVPFEGEEPPPVQDEPATTATTDEPKFTAGRYQGQTIPEVFALGKEGVSYLQWAFKSWKTNPLRAALDEFAKDHPDVAA